MNKSLADIRVQWIAFLSIILLLFVNISAVFAQEVISTGGDYHSNSSGSISNTIGESVIETYKASDIIVTQGFQQSNLLVTAIEEYAGLGFDILAYPNPANEYVILWESKEDKTGFYFLLYDSNGKLLIDKQILDSGTLIPFEGLAQGEYILQVTMENKELKSFEIIKSK